MSAASQEGSGGGLLRTLGVMDLVRYRNVESDTAMRRSLAGESERSDQSDSDEN